MEYHCHYDSQSTLNIRFKLKLMRANATFNLHIRLNSNSPISIKASEMELYLMCVGLFFPFFWMEWMCFSFYFNRFNGLEKIYLVKLVKHTCFTNAEGGGKVDMAVVRSYCCSILNRIISTRWTGSRWKRKLLMYESCFMSSINVWLPTFGTRLKNKMSNAALLVLFNWSALGMTSGTCVER